MTFQRDLAWRHLDLVQRSSVSHQLARYALALRYELLPPEVVHQAKRCLLDALGCAIGAYEAPGRTICEDTAREIGGPEEATVFCSGLRTSALNASLVNSFLVRFMELGDSGGGGHGGDGLSSILAVAEREKAGGRDFLTSLVLSYEIGARFRDSLVAGALGAARRAGRGGGGGEKEVGLGFSDALPRLFPLEGWTVDIRAGLNQPPAIGRLMGLTEEQIANAIGICLSHTLPLGILDSDREENVMAKNIRFGWAAHDAIMSCMLAKRGFTGPVRIVESDAGIRTVIARGEMDLERLLDFSGWRILNTRFKTLPVNGTTMGHLSATLAIVIENDLRPEDIASVRIGASFAEASHTTTPAKKYPRNAESADHSAFYANALAVKERAFGADAFRPDKFTDPVVLDLIEKITVEVDPALGHHQGTSEIVTHDGRRFRKRVDSVHGRGDDPLSDAELEDKLRSMASRHLPDAHIARLLEMCWNVEKLDDVAALTRLMVFPAP